MYTPTSRSSLATAALAVALLAPPVSAVAAPYAYLWDTNECRSNDELYLNRVVYDSGVSRTALEPVLPRIRSVSTDLPVLLFISRNSGRPVAAIVDLRTRGLSWLDLFRQLGINYDLLFVDLNRDPGPPYATAWTSWRANPSSVRLTDYQIRDLVQLQFVHRLSGVPVFEVAQTRARGRSPIVLVAEKYRRTNATAGIPPGHGGVPPGHGGVPPGRVKSDVPPGHRGVVPGRAQAKTKVHAPRVNAEASTKAIGKGRGKGQGRQGQDRGQGKGKGQGGGKGRGRGGH